MVFSCRNIMVYKIKKQMHGLNKIKNHRPNPSNPNKTWDQISRLPADVILNWKQPATLKKVAVWKKTPWYEQCSKKHIWFHHHLILVSWWLLYLPFWQKILPKLLGCKRHIYIYIQLGKWRGLLRWILNNQPLSQIKRVGWPLYSKGPALLILTYMTPKNVHTI